MILNPKIIFKRQILRPYTNYNYISPLKYVEMMCSNLLNVLASSFVPHRNFILFFKFKLYSVRLITEYYSILWNPFTENFNTTIGTIEIVKRSFYCIHLSRLNDQHILHFFLIKHLVLLNYNHTSNIFFLSNLLFNPIDSLSLMFLIMFNILSRFSIFSIPFYITCSLNDFFANSNYL